MDRGLYLQYDMLKIIQKYFLQVSTAIYNYTVIQALEHVYMRPQVNSNRFEISNCFRKSFRLHGNFTVATCKW